MITFKFTLGTEVAGGAGLGVEAGVVGLYGQTVVPTDARVARGGAGLVGVVSRWALLENVRSIMSYYQH